MYLLNLEVKLFGRNKIYMLALFVFGLFVMSCSESDSTTEPAETFVEPGEVVLIDNANHIITVNETEEFITIIMEGISDTTNNFSGTYPELDFPRILVDVNHNSIVDSGADVSFSTNYSSMCNAYLYSENSGSGCGGFQSSAIFEAAFSSSANESRDHVIWTFTIPKSEIFMDSRATFVVKFFEAGVGYTTYPTANNHPDNGSTSFNAVLSYP